MMAGGAPMDCAQPLIPHITANVTNITACGNYGMRQPQQSHQSVHRRREDESRRHEPFDVAVVGNESVYEFPDGIGEQEYRSDDTQLGCIERPLSRMGFFS